MSVDGSSHPESTPVKISDIPQQERQQMGSRWAAMDNPGGKTLEQKVADLKSRQEQGQVDKVAQQQAELEVKMIKDPGFRLQVISERWQKEIAERTAKIQQEIDAVTQQEDSTNVVQQLGELMDQYHGERSQMAIGAMRERLNQVPAPLPKELAQTAITELGTYAGAEMNSDTERYHDVIRENRRQAGDIITTTALRSEDPEVMEGAVNQLAKGLRLGDIGVGANHTLVIERIQTLADASFDPRVHNAAISHLDAYASLKPYPGQRNFHMGYLGSRAYEPVQQQARAVVQKLQPSPEGKTA